MADHDLWIKAIVPSQRLELAPERKSMGGQIQQGPGVKPSSTVTHWEIGDVAPKRGKTDAVTQRERAAV